jgi:hypothetical protein
MVSLNERVDIDPAPGKDQFMPFYDVYNLLIHRNSGKIAIFLLLKSRF